MKLYIDADTLPTIAKEMIIKTANRTMVPAVFVANRPIKLPPSSHLSMMVVESGFDMADNYIVKQVGHGDLVITNDIPLANDVLERGAKALSAHGIEFTQENIKPKLNARDFMESLRGTNVLDYTQIAQQKPYSNKDKIAFANALNRLVKPSSSTNLIQT